MEMTPLLFFYIYSTYVNIMSHFYYRCVRDKSCSYKALKFLLYYLANKIIYVKYEMVLIRIFLEWFLLNYRRVVLEMFYCKFKL